MATALEALTPELEAFIGRQHVFFVATAPAGPQGHVNLSPKGMDSFRVFSPNAAGYLDLTGSGNETAAHLLDNGRITVMFCGFEDKPIILRLYGRGSIVLPGSSAWGELSARFPQTAGARQIIHIDIHRVSTSCGYAVPRMDFVSDRDKLVQWARSKGPQALSEYRLKNNRKSIDGLPAPVADDPQTWIHPGIKP